jgi:hypothetical protein
MAAARLTCRSDPLDNGCSVWFYCFIYDTAAELQAAARRLRPHDVDWDGTQGCFHPSLTFAVCKDGKYRRSANTAFIGTMRLNRENLLPHIVIHECTHAAVNYVNVVKLQSGYMIGKSNIHTEEALCYAVHEFSTSLLAQLDMLK